MRMQTRLSVHLTSAHVAELTAEKKIRHSRNETGNIALLNVLNTDFYLSRVVTRCLIFFLFLVTLPLWSRVTEMILGACSSTLILLTPSRKTSDSASVYFCLLSLNVPAEQMAHE